MLASRNLFRGICDFSNSMHVGGNRSAGRLHRSYWQFAFGTCCTIVPPDGKLTFSMGTEDPVIPSQASGVAHLRVHSSQDLFGLGADVLESPSLPEFLDFKLFG